MPTNFNLKKFDNKMSQLYTRKKKKKINKNPVSLLKNGEVLPQ
jgi:hypothetical protein